MPFAIFRVQTYNFFCFSATLGPKKRPSGREKDSNEQKNEGSRKRTSRSPFLKKAVTYSPALHCSTIGAGRLNFSVRDGKRWDPAAIAT